MVETVRKKETELDTLNEKTKEQLSHWNHAIEVFTHRFRAPFTVSIDNESKVVFNGEPARLRFEYKRHGLARRKTKEELMECLSVGEKRALYLLQILFDLKKVQSSAEDAGKKHLVIGR